MPRTAKLDLQRTLEHELYNKSILEKALQILAHKYLMNVPNIAPTMCTANAIIERVEARARMEIGNGKQQKKGQ